MPRWSERHVLEDTRYTVNRYCSIVRLPWSITHRISILRHHIVCGYCCALPYISIFSFPLKTSTQLIKTRSPPNLSNPHLNRALFTSIMSFQHNSDLQPSAAGASNASHSFQPIAIIDLTSDDNQPQTDFIVREEPRYSLVQCHTSYDMALAKGKLLQTMILANDTEAGQYMIPA
jgi:hypothetical protein